MIKKSYIEKMHKEIDGLLSESQRKKLYRYLETNPEAKKLYEELSQTAQLLGDLPQVVPSPNIKKYILNSINPNHYPAVRRSAKIGSLFALPMARPSAKLAFVFSLGCLIGIFVYAAIMQQRPFQHSLNSTNLYGTIGVDGPLDSDASTVFPVAASETNGTVTVTKGEESFALVADLLTAQATDLRIEYDAASLHYSGFSTTSRKISLDLGLNDIRISSLGDVQFSLYFNKINTNVFDVTLKFFRDGECIYKQDISL